MNRKFKIEDGYQVIMIFFISLWLEFLKPLMIRQDLITPEITYIPEQNTPEYEKDNLHSTYNLFFMCVCMGFDCIEEFSETLTAVLGTPREHQPGMEVTEEQLFSVALEFCRYYHQQFSYSLGLVLNILEDMRVHLKRHKEELIIWNRTVIDVLEHGVVCEGKFQFGF